jgi:RNA polymerase sigma factor (sigma-70 family)
VEETRGAGNITRLRTPASAARADRDVDDAYRELRSSVARELARRVGSRDLADDLTQDVFVDLLLAARRSPPSDTRAWLARVAQRRAADTIGSAVRERAVRERLAATSRLRDQGAAADPDIAMTIRASMATLSESQREVISLRLLQGLSFAHSGLRLGMSEDAARMRFARAMRQLRGELGRAGVERR